jgi:cysteine sulfinate desulfinase/cysteine desulfurase-like protein
VILHTVGLPEQRAARTLRIGIGRFTSAADIDYAAAALSAAHAACEAATPILAQGLISMTRTVARNA